MSRGRKPPSQRQLRVAKLVRQALGEAFVMRRIDEPGLDLAGVSVTEVDISPDLKQATVYVRPLLAEQKEGLAEALNENAGRIRAVIAPALKGLKFMPRLVFALDTAADYGAHIDDLLRQARQDNND